jgi:addiction module HigA family antidote
MEMFNPPHPGEIIREDCIKAVGLTVTAAAAELGISRQSLSEVLNGHNGVSADMALRLENKGWGSAEGWLRNQVSYDLWQARNRDEAPSSRVRLKAHRKTSRPKSSAQKTAEKKATNTSYRKTKKAAAKSATKTKRRA